MVMLSCAARNTDKMDYLNDYYPSIYKSDSLFHYSGSKEDAFLLYRSVYKKHPVLGNDFYDSYKNYLKSGYLTHNDFGGRKSLITYLKSQAGYLTYKSDDSLLNVIYKAYLIDDDDIEKIITHSRKKIKVRLRDSIIVIKERDQENNRSINKTLIKNDSMNEKSLLRIFNNEGFPGYDKIGGEGPKRENLNLTAVLMHMNYGKNYETFKAKLYTFLKNGELDPLTYALFIDKHNNTNRKPSEYGYLSSSQIDTIRINSNRKKIGLPTLSYENLKNK